jgi:hypothetical protein
MRPSRDRAVVILGAFPYTYSGSERRTPIEEIRELKKNLIHANLSSSWAFGLRMEAEEKEENEARAQCCQELLDRITAQPSLSPSEQQGYLGQIATFTAQGRISPFHSRRLTRTIRRSRSL